MEMHQIRHKETRREERDEACLIYSCKKLQADFTLGHRDVTVTGILVLHHHI